MDKHLDRGSALHTVPSATAETGDGQAAADSMGDGQVTADAINRVLQKALSADNLDDLGHECLDVVLDLTGSWYGLIATVTPDGCIHDLGIAREGPAARDIIHPAANHSLPRPHVLRGLSGHVVSSGVSYMTNDVGSDPRLTGDARGHPALKSFLGVPLKSDGATVGLIAVANRESGYTNAHVRLLEAIAPAIETAIDRKRASDESRRTAQLLEAHVRNSPLAVIEFDPDFRVVSWSPGAERVFGYTDDEILGVAVSDLQWVYEDDMELVHNEMRGFLEGSLPQCVTLNRNYRKDGRVIWCEWYSSAIYADDGSLRSVQSLVLDLTERIDAEKQVAAAKDHFELLTGTTSMLLHTDEPLEAVHGIAEAVRQHLGCALFFNYVYEKPGMLRLNASGGLEPSVAETIRWLEEGQAVCGCVARDGAPIVASHVQDDSDPRLDLVRGMGVTAYACMPLIVGGSTQGTLSFGAIGLEEFSEEHLALMRTVAEQVSVALERRQGRLALEESEARFRSVLEHAIDAAYRRDLVEDRYDYMSPAIEAITGFTADEFATLPIDEVFDRIHPDDRLRVQECIAEGERTGSIKCDYRFRRKDGTYVWMSDTAKVLYGDDGKPRYRSGTVRDSSDLMHAMQALQAAQTHHAFMLRLSDRMAPLADANQVRVTAARTIAEHLGASRAYYAVVDIEARYFSIDSEYAREGLAFLGGVHRFEDYPSSVAMLSKGTVAISDTASCPTLSREEADKYASAGIGALVAAPLLRDGRPVSILAVAHSKPHEWTLDEISLVEEVAARTWSANERARAENELRRSLSRTTMLKELAAAVASSLDAENLAERTLAVVQRLMGADAGAVYLLEEQGGPAYLVSQFGLGTTARIEKLAVDGSTLGGRAMLTQKLQVSVGGTPLLPESEERAEAAGVPGYRWAAAPLKAHDRCIGIVALGFRGHRSFNSDELEMFEAVSNQLSIGLEKARLYQSEHSIAETLQETLVVLPRHVPGLEYSRAYESATYELGRVGGDFIDVFPVHGSIVGITLGDVSGKGIDAAVTTALVRTTLRVHAVDGLPPADVVRKANQVMRRFTETEAFATLWFGLINVKTGVLRYVCAGHPPALVVPATSEPVELVCKDPILGAFDEAAFFENQTILIAGDRLLLYSDGATEARSPDGSFLGSTGFVDMVLALRDVPTRDLAPAIMAELRTFSNGLLRDDVALLTVEPTKLRRTTEDPTLISFDFDEPV